MLARADSFALHDIITTDVKDTVFDLSTNFGIDNDEKCGLFQA